MYALGEKGLEAVQRFNAREFLESHYLLEKLWVEAAGEKKRYLQGIILIGAAVIKLRLRNNRESAQRLLKKGSGILREIDPDLAELDIRQLLGDADDLLNQLSRCGPEGLEVIGDEDILRLHLKSP